MNLNFKNYTDLLNFACDYPKRVISITLFLVLALGAGMYYLEIEPDSINMLGKNDPSVISHRKIQQEFDLANQLIVAILPIDTLEPTIKDLPNRELQWASLAIINELSKIDGISKNKSIGPLSFNDQGKRNLAYSQLAVLKSKLLEGLIISNDRQGIGILVNTDPDIERNELFQNIQKTIDRLEYDRSKFTVIVTGPLIVENTVTHHILDDLGKTFPICCLSLFTCLLILLGSLRKTMIVIIGSLLTSICIVGIMGYLGIPVYLVSTIIPILLISICVADEIHVIVTLSSITSKSQDLKGSILQVYKILKKPILLTSITSSLAMLTLSIGDVLVIKHLGLLIGAGILLNLYFTFFFTPALVRVGLYGRDFRFRPAYHFFQTVSIVPKKPVFFVLAGLLVVGIYRLSVDDDWLWNFDQESDLVKDYEKITQNFYDPYKLLIELKLDSTQSWYANDRYNSLRNVGSSTEVSLGDKVISGPIWLDLLKDSLLPQYEDEIYNRQPVYLLDFLGSAPAVYLTNSLMSPNHSKALVHVYYESTTVGAVKQSLSSFRKLREKDLILKKAQISLGGEAFMSYVMVSKIVSHFRLSILSSAVVLFIISLIAFQTVKSAVIVMIPVVLANCMILGAMGWLGIPIGVATSMIPIVGMGLGIDFAIHLYHRKLHQIELSNKTVNTCLQTNAAALSLAFLSFTLSSTQSLQVIGLLLSITILLTIFVTIIVFEYIQSSSIEPNKTEVKKLAHFKP